MNQSFLLPTLSLSSELKSHFIVHINLALLFYCLHDNTLLFWNCSAQASDWIVHFRNFLKDPLTLQRKAAKDVLHPQILCILHLNILICNFHKFWVVVSWFLFNPYQVPALKDFP